MSSAHPPSTRDLLAIRPGRSLDRKRLLHVLLPLFLGSVIAYLDRVNVAYAALTMNRDLGFSASVFGLGAGIFFAGYVLFEIPGALIAERWSARIWLARIMVTWGLVSCLMAFVRSEGEFYLLRFLLGAAEASYYPVAYASWMLAVPMSLALVGMLVVAGTSMRRTEPRWHGAVPLFIAALGMGFGVAVRNPVWGFVGVCLAGIGVYRPVRCLVVLPDHVPVRRGRSRGHWPDQLVREHRRLPRPLVHRRAQGKHGLGPDFLPGTREFAAGGGTPDAHSAETETRCSKEPAVGW